MSAPKALCACRMPAAECCCDDDAPLPPPREAPERRTCRFCKRKVVRGKHGWRLDVKSAAGYSCPDGPLGSHGVREAAEADPS